MFIHVIMKNVKQQIYDSCSGVWVGGLSRILKDVHSRLTSNLPLVQRVDNVDIRNCVHFAKVKMQKIRNTISNSNPKKPKKILELGK